MPRGNAGFIGPKATPGSAAVAPAGFFKLSEIQQLLSVAQTYVHLRRSFSWLITKLFALINIK